MTGFINDLCETFTEQANKKQITLQFHHEGADHLKLWVDPVNFDKIILNILSNAFKFTPEGAVWTYGYAPVRTPPCRNHYNSMPKLP